MPLDRRQDSVKLRGSVARDRFIPGALAHEIDRHGVSTCIQLTRHGTTIVQPLAPDEPKRDAEKCVVNERLVLNNILDRLIAGHPSQGRSRLVAKPKLRR